MQAARLPQGTEESDPEREVAPAAVDLHIPSVYGKRLRLSTLAAIIALLIGGSLYGVAGAILVLPFVAAYPIIEKIWLHEYLSPELVADHKALERAAESGSEQAVEAVLRGEVHAAERNRRI